VSTRNTTKMLKHVQQNCIPKPTGTLCLDHRHAPMSAKPLDYVASMLPYGCFYGLDCVMLLWSELSVCLGLLL
jgi:hypothetical protein